MNSKIEDCMRNLCWATARGYIETLFLKPLSCFNDKCSHKKRCTKKKTMELCHEQKFLQYKEMFSEHIETPEFWFKGAERELLFSEIKEIYKKCNCLADVRRELNLDNTKEKKEERRKTFAYVYKVYDKKDNKFIFEGRHMRDIAEILNSSIGVVRGTLAGKNSYLKDDYIIKKVIK